MAPEGCGICDAVGIPQALVMSLLWFEARPVVSGPDEVTALICTLDTEKLQSQSQMSVQSLPPAGRIRNDIIKGPSCRPEANKQENVSGERKSKRMP